MAIRVLGICALALAASTRATLAIGEDAPSDAGAVCTNQSNGVEAEECLHSALTRAQATLKQKYHDIEMLALAKKKGELLVQLAQSQQTWEDHLHATCDGLMEQATSDDPVSYEDAVSCRIQLTLQRIRDLDRTFYAPLHH